MCAGARRGRRFLKHMKTTVAGLASLLGATFEGRADASITGAAAVDEASEGDIVLAEDSRFFARAIKSAATCILVGRGLSSARGGKTVIEVDRPREAFAKVLEFFRGQEPLPDAGIGQGAVIGRDVTLGRRVAIGANCCIEDGASIGDGCVLFPSVYIGSGVTIGQDTKIYPNVTVYRNCTIGSRVVLHAGAIIGADGFGYTCAGEALIKFPHTGTVQIGDDVEIGANSTVDRAKTGATVIGSGTKIDNLVHIAHNVKIGSNCVIVAMSGVAGSVEIGDNVTLAAQVGVKDHVRIGDGCVVAARAGVIGNLRKGSVVSGFPARDHSTEKRLEAARLHLPEILHRLRALEAQVHELRGGGECEDGGAEH